MQVKKGQWYTMCCEETLRQSEHDFCESDGGICRGPWDTKEEAIAALAEQEVCWEKKRKANLAKVDWDELTKVYGL